MQQGKPRTVLQLPALQGNGVQPAYADALLNACIPIPPTLPACRRAVSACGDLRELTLYTAALQQHVHAAPDLIPRQVRPAAVPPVPGPGVQLPCLLLLPLAAAVPCIYSLHHPAAAPGHPILDFCAVPGYPTPPHHPVVHLPHTTLPRPPALGVPQVCHRGAVPPHLPLPRRQSGGPAHRPAAPHQQVRPARCMCAGLRGAVQQQQRCWCLRNSPPALGCLPGAWQVRRMCGILCPVPDCLCCLLARANTHCWPCTLLLLQVHVSVGSRSPDSSSCTKAGAGRRSGWRAAATAGHAADGARAGWSCQGGGWRMAAARAAAAAGSSGRPGATWLPRYRRYAGSQWRGHSGSHGHGH